MNLRDTPLVSQMALRDALFVVSHRRLFFRTGLFRSWRTSNVPIVLNLQGLATKSSAAGLAYYCWPLSPQLICHSACAEYGALARPMNDSTVGIPGAPQRHSATPNRFPRYISLMVLLAALSTVTGYQVARIEISGANWFRNTTLLTPASTQVRALVPASAPSAVNADLEAISHLAPQQQAERLLELAVQRP